MKYGMAAGTWSRAKANSKTEVRVTDVILVTA